MTIHEIAYKINDIAKKDHLFGRIHSVRSKYGIAPRTLSPFADFSIKDEYAFHAGGRKELQFNIGYDYLFDTDVFRYGIAFSLKEDKTLHNSKAEFRTKIEAFNKYLSANPTLLDGFEMWYYSGKQFQQHFERVISIDDRLFQAENFIFIGKYIEKEISEVTEAELNEVVESFDYLMPLYEAVQFGNVREKRIARLCWNDNGWVKPSGRDGKSRDKNSHEARFGYGHEEWLFDAGKLIDGYRYGFLEPVRKQHQAFENKSYDVWLYTINGITKKRYWVGEITNVGVIDEIEARRIEQMYLQKGWIKEMEAQIKASDKNAKGFSNWKGLNLINVRFKPVDAKLHEYIPLDPEHPIKNYRRYTFAELTEDFIVGTFNKDSFDLTNPTPVEHSGTTVKTTFHLREPKAIEITYLHEAISKRLTQELIVRYGESNVFREKRAGYGGNKIDIVVKHNDSLYFYEIKTYPSLRSSIRDAFGQLIEYCHWTNQTKAKKLIVVTQPCYGLDDAKIYFKHLRETYNLPIFYQSYDFENNILSEEY